MGEVIAYESDQNGCSYQLSLDSGEYIQISTNGSPGPSIRISEFWRGRRLIDETIWETDNPEREIVRLYPEQVSQVRSQTDILNVLKDDLLRCESILEIKKRLA